jgi:alkylhydroperoxidase/carboxymuconolactone decarboxylase family protein YurZ
MKKKDFAEEIPVNDIIEEFQGAMNSIIPNEEKEELFENNEMQRENKKDFLMGYEKNYKEIFRNNALTEKIKVLIALASASAIYHPYCINLFINDAKEKGWSDEQIKETIQVATAVNSAFVSVHAVEKINQMEIEQVPHE